LGVGEKNTPPKIKNKKQKFIQTQPHQKPSLFSNASLKIYRSTYLYSTMALLARTATSKASVAAAARRPAVRAQASAANKAAAAAAAALVVATTSAGAAQAADLALGANVFNGNCAACHMGGGNNVIPDHTLQKAAIEQFLTGGFNVEAIETQVRNGKGAMPALEGRLDDDEIVAVAAYVYDQAAGNKW
jgi:cytochrome c6